MKAQDLIISKWVNSQPYRLEQLSGKVVVIHAFQMLCPACVMHGVPQAKKIFSLFSEANVFVMGLHTVFEHHEAMQEQSLRAFMHEFRIDFPVAIDQPSDTSRIPKTMELYEMRGTPTWILIDKKGEIRRHIFGDTDDLILGAEIARLTYEDTDFNLNIYKRGG